MKQEIRNGAIAFTKTKWCLIGMAIWFTMALVNYYFLFNGHSPWGLFEYFSFVYATILFDISVIFFLIKLWFFVAKKFRVYVTNIVKEVK